MATDESKRDERKMAADKRRQAEEGYTEDERKAQLVEALLVERQGYVVRGLNERVAAVDEQIRANGGKVPSSRGGQA